MILNFSSRSTIKLLTSTPNWVEIVAIVALALATRLLWLPHFQRHTATLVVVSVAVTAFVYASVGRGRLFRYVGWVAPRRRLFWIYAFFFGIAGGFAVILTARAARMGLGTAPSSELLFGLTAGPVIEEMLYRGVVFSVAYVTASSIARLAPVRIAFAVLISSWLFAWSHSMHFSLRAILILCMGIGYAILRWRSNSTVAAAFMHLSYNAVITIAMCRIF